MKFGRGLLGHEYIYKGNFLHYLDDYVMAHLRMELTFVYGVVAGIGKIIGVMV